MSRDPLPSYRFSTPAQWASGLLTRASVSVAGTIAPVQPFARASTIHSSAGARSPAFDRDGNLYWIDDAGLLNRLPVGERESEAVVVATDVSASARLVAGRNSLWVIGRNSDTVLRYDLASLQLIQTVEIDGEALDLSAHLHDGVWVLVKQGDASSVVVQLDCAGHVAQKHVVPSAFGAPSALAFLRKAGVIALLTRGGRALALLRLDGCAAREPLSLDALGPCFTATLLAGNGFNRLVLAGPDRWKNGSSLVFVLDASGELLDGLSQIQEIHGVALNAQGLAIATASGVALHAATPDEPGVESSCVFMTPVLHSPQTSDERGWLRAEIQASMRQGASLSVEYASTSDLDLVEQVRRAASDRSLPANLRLTRINALLEGKWSEPALMLGSDEGAPGTQGEYAAPLFAVGEPYMWLRLTLTAAPGATMPTMSGLRVLYPDRSLLKNLPAIYTTASEVPDFTRRLLGVLETTTQGLDRTIASLGSLIHPQTAPVAWLDTIARWIGVPWNDALDETRKRALIGAAPGILAARGTRGALELLLKALFPGTPARFAVTDYTAQYDVPRLGGGNCAGPRLPVLLGGLPQSAITLNRRAILGKARLCRSDLCADPLAQLTGRVDVAVTATSAERSQFAPWLEALLRAVVPITCRLVLRWRGPRLKGWSTVLDSGLELAAIPATSLNASARLGFARLPIDRPVTLAQYGPDVGPASLS